MHTCVVWREFSVWVRPRGAGAAGLACRALSQGSQGFATSPSHVAWLGFLTAWRPRLHT